MSYFGRKAEAMADCHSADIQIDGNSPSNTSPVRNGSDTAGAAPMEGEHMFTKSRTRGRFVGNQRDKIRREFPSEGVGSK
jgi:hypothetical protein